MLRAWGVHKRCYPPPACPRPIVPHSLLRPRQRRYLSTSSETIHDDPSKVLILGIETSCDDTACAVVRGDRTVLSEAIARQDDLHGARMGIMPSAAAQGHHNNIDRTVNSALEQAEIHVDDLTAIAVTRGPGMGVCLAVGLQKAKDLALKYDKPVIAVNHMEGHALIARMCNEAPFPFLTLLISGGHTMLVVCQGVGKYIQLGTTLDDALGEAYDKIARLLGLPWEGGGGKALEQLAKNGVTNERVRLPMPMKSIKNCNTSYAGLKTAVKRVVDDHCELVEQSEQFRADIAYAFQKTAVDHLMDRVERAVHWCEANEGAVTRLVVSGGVASNSYIRLRLHELCVRYAWELITPPPKLCTDNGVMIAWAGVENYLNGSMLFAPEAFQSVSYEPKWKLDPRGIDYFPNTHRKDPIKARLKSSVNDIEKCERMLSHESAHFHLDLALKGAKSAINGKDYEKARWICHEGMKRESRDAHKTLGRLLQKVDALEETERMRLSQRHLIEGKSNI